MLVDACRDVHRCQITVRRARLTTSRCIPKPPPPRRSSRAIVSAPVCFTLNNPLQLPLPLRISARMSFVVTFSQEFLTASEAGRITQASGSCSGADRHQSTQDTPTRLTARAVRRPDGKTSSNKASEPRTPVPTERRPPWPSPTPRWRYPPPSPASPGRLPVGNVRPKRTPGCRPSGQSHTRRSRRKSAPRLHDRRQCRVDHEIKVLPLVLKEVAIFFERLDSVMAHPFAEAGADEAVFAIVQSNPTTLIHQCNDVFKCFGLSDG